MVTITGTVSSDNFAFYKLEYAHGADATDGFIYLGGANYPVEASVLGELNTATLSSGPYTLRLTVVDQVGNFVPPCRIAIMVAN
jgi:hypothetical protein